MNILVHGTIILAERGYLPYIIENTSRIKEKTLCQRRRKIEDDRRKKNGGSRT
jgi:hypothetical protein